jgi:DNA-binding NtrC family response regulator
MIANTNEPARSRTAPRQGALSRFLERVGQSDEHVVISGAPRREREQVGRLIHASSPRRRSAFVVYDSSDPKKGGESSPDREFDETAIGRSWSLATGGTLFLVELYELSDREQGRLLRALEARDARGRGADRPHRVRIIAATSHEPSVALRGTLRSSLFHRLNVMHVHVPELFDPAQRGSRSRIESNEPLLTFKEEKSRLLEDWEPKYLRELLGHVDGNVTVAARMAGIARAHMYRLLKKHRLAR